MGGGGLAGTWFVTVTKVRGYRQISVFDKNCYYW